MKLNIKQTLKNHGIKQIDVAEALGISKGAFSLTISGNISLTSLEKISKVTGIEVWEFFITKEELAAEGERRRKALNTPTATLFCPCCGNRICVQQVE